MGKLLGLWKPFVAGVAVGIAVTAYFASRQYESLKRRAVVVAATAQVATAHAEALTAGTERKVERLHRRREDILRELVPVVVQDTSIVAENARLSAEVASLRSVIAITDSIVSLERHRADSLESLLKMVTERTVDLAGRIGRLHGTPRTVRIGGYVLAAVGGAAIMYWLIGRN